MKRERERKGKETDIEKGSRRKNGGERGVVVRSERKKQRADEEKKEGKERGKC
jgi:hypothetical protein